MTLGTLLSHWMADLGGVLANVAGFLLLAGVMLHARRTHRAEQRRDYGHLRLISGSGRSGRPRPTGRGQIAIRTLRSHR